jgi:hypothetical protein
MVYLLPLAFLLGVSIAMISVVNGYVCLSSCEVASAKQGKDPSAPPGSPVGAPDKGKASAFANRPATILDGALAGVDAVAPTDTSQPPRFDRLA